MAHTFRIILKATISSVLRHFALYTRPKEPSPIKPKTSYFSIVNALHVSVLRRDRYFTVSPYYAVSYAVYSVLVSLNRRCMLQYIAHYLTVS